jgi:hypothetical protein
VVVAEVEVVVAEVDVVGAKVLSSTCHCSFLNLIKKGESASQCGFLGAPVASMDAGSLWQY